MDAPYKSADPLRVSPLGRARGVNQAIDLHAALRQLREESTPVRRGHRQITLFHRTPVSHVLFAFDAGGSLPRHKANGLVTIHVVQGRMIVEAEGVTHELAAGHVLVLEPNAPHSVHAVEESGMLLTVDMEDCA